MSTKYEIKNGQICREGTPVANRAPDGTLDYLPDMDRYRAPVTAWLKEQGMDKPPVTPPEVAARQATPRVAGQTQNVTVTEDSATTTTVGETTPESLRIAELEAQLAKLQAAADRPRAVAVPAKPFAVLSKTSAGNDPLLKQYIEEGAPAFDPMAGDKTPTFVDWLHKTHPEDAAIRYSGRKTHLGLV